MKNILLTILALFTALPLIAQEPTGFENKIHRNVQEKANPKEGIEKFREDFIAKLDLSSVPVDVEQIAIRMRVTVEKDGSFVDDVKVLFYEIKNDSIFQMTNTKLNKEVVRVLKNMPPWNPAKHEGEIVRSVYTISMVVKIHVTVEENIEEEIREFTEQKAEPINGMDQFRSDYIRRFRMPGGIPSDVKQLSVRMKFVIEKDGTLSNIQALSNDYGVGDEGIRVLKTMPKWKPAMQDGVPVRSSFTWYYNLNLNNNL